MKGAAITEKGLLELLDGFIKTKVLIGAYHLDLFTRCAEPRPRAALLAELGAPERAATILVNACVALGLLVEEEGRLRTVRWGVRFAAAPPVGATCALAHAPLGPFDEVVEPSEVLREEVLCDALAVDGERLIARYGAHDRVLLAVELEPPDGPRVRLLAERRELD